MPMHTVYIALGSNLGNRLAYLHQGIDCLKAGVLQNVVASIVLETPALVLPNSPADWDRPYLNALVRGETDLDPYALLARLKAIEQQAGRDPNHERWSPRTLDLDIVLYDNECIQSEQLSIPHSGLYNRWFLAHLMALMNPDGTDPKTQGSFAELATQILRPEVPFIRSFVLEPRCVGIVNVTPDSFSDGELSFTPDAAVARCHQLIQEGATIVDIGAQSTRPDGVQIAPEEEWKRLKPVLDRLNFDEVTVSIDTFQAPVIKQLVEQYPIAWINTFPHLLSDEILHIIANQGCSVCIMHALSVPVKNNECLRNLNPTLIDWSTQQVERLIHLGFSTDKIILDFGIGFGKSAYQTKELLQRYGEWAAKTGCPTLLGHSRKSYLNAFSPQEASQRDAETVAISLALRHQVDYIRIHNVALHQRALVAQQWLAGGYAY
ncbi:MAG: dihydropteroate synthase [Opitutales bacterium]|nr:dihydropteroate synthase [Opitutales bacterium]